MLRFDKPTIDLGKVPRDIVTHEFTATNNGTTPAIITSVSVTCGCTVPTYEPVIQPGQQGVITLKVDKRSENGSFSKGATVYWEQDGYQYNQSIRISFSFA